jgi:cytochrome c oxidase assembly protein subunit 15
MERWFVILARTGVVLALVVVTMGAWVRLTDAGLGCPDWPGCYGRLIVSEEIAADPAAAELTADRPLEAGKAWREMIHRYFATGIGFVCLLLATIAVIRRREPGQPVVLPIALLGLVILQGLLGMWTVTLQLLPLVVVLHLIGGMSVLGCLFWLARLRAAAVAAAPTLKALGLAAGAALALQIFLGGWTSANYAAVACPDFPTCQTQWWPGIADFGAGFDLLHEIGPNYEGGVLDHPARVAIHFVHRLGALLATLLIAAFAAGVWRRVEVRPAGAAMLAALAAQIAIGISIVLLGGPKSVLPLAVAHNGVAALLLLTVLHANQRIRQPG